MSHVIQRPADRALKNLKFIHSRYFNFTFIIEIYYISENVLVKTIMLLLSLQMRANPASGPNIFFTISDAGKGCLHAHYASSLTMEVSGQFFFCLV